MNKKIMRLLCALICVIIAGGVYASLDPQMSLTVEASALDVDYEMSKQYKKSKYYDNLTQVSLTGDEQKDTLAIALSQLGYHEGDSEDDFGGDNLQGTRDFVEYNLLWGKVDNKQGNGKSYGYYWCASFVNWCLRQAGVDEEASAGSEISCLRWISQCRKSKIFNPRGEYTPQSGDMIFFRDSDSMLEATHIGLVLFCDGKRVYTIEGNTSSGDEYSSDGEYVALKSYALTSKYIVGYATPRYNKEGSYLRVDYTGERRTCGQYISADEIKLYSDNALTKNTGKIPQHTLLTVLELDGEIARLEYNNDGKRRSGYVKIDDSFKQLTSSQTVYFVNYYDGDGNMIYHPQVIIGDEERSVYRNFPSLDGAAFVGWRSNIENGKMFSSGQAFGKIEQDIDLISVFDSNTYTVTFEAPDKKIIATFSGLYGTEIQIPTPNAPDGYVFAGWDKTPGDKIVGNAVYTAKFVSEDSVSTSALPSCQGTVSILPLTLCAALCLALTFKKKK